jgi:hypothetical protein
MMGNDNTMSEFNAPVVAFAFLIQIKYLTFPHLGKPSNSQLS